MFDGNIKPYVDNNQHFLWQEQLLKLSQNIDSIWCNPSCPVKICFDIGHHLLRCLTSGVNPIKDLV